MPTHITISQIIIFLVVINAVTFIAYWLDKKAAKNGGWRISEKTLLTFALLGGTIAAIYAQKIFRHKTKKGSFKSKFFLVIFVQIIVASYFAYQSFLGI